MEAQPTWAAHLGNSKNSRMPALSCSNGKPGRTSSQQDYKLRLCQRRQVRNDYLLLDAGDADAADLGGHRIVASEQEKQHASRHQLIFRFWRSKDVIFVQLTLAEGRTLDQTVSDVVYTAMMEILKAPNDDRFQVIAEHDKSNFIYDPNFFGISRRKRGFYIICTIASVSEERMFSSASLELGREDWSFGNMRRPCRPRSPRLPGSVRSKKLS